MFRLASLISVPVSEVVVRSRRGRFVDRGEKGGEGGERVAEAVAKKEAVVGEICEDVGDAGILLLLSKAVEFAVEVLGEEECRDDLGLCCRWVGGPDDIIWLFVGQMKMGRPIVSFAKVSIFGLMYSRLLRAVCLLLLLSKVWKG